MAKDFTKIDLLNKNKKYFSEYFGNDAEEYYMLYIQRYFKGLSLEKIEIDTKLSRTYITHRIKEVDDFLLNPKGILDSSRHDISMDAEVRLPNEFLDAMMNLSYSANNFVMYAIYLEQNNMIRTIFLKDLISWRTQYKDLSYRKLLIEELDNFSFILRSNTTIKVFDKLIDNKGNISYDFTNGAKLYLNNQIYHSHLHDVFQL